MRRVTSVLLVCGLVGCATLSRDSFDDRFGRPDPTRYDKPLAPPASAVGYRSEVQPILERRCVVCHGCYDAPCQIKLGAWEGIARGASKENVYDSGRLREARLSRLFVDAQLPSQWREMGFSAVLNERSPTPEANLAASVLYRALAMKQNHPLPAGPVLGAPFDFSLDRSASCPRIEQFDAYERKVPLAGMPYGLPALNAREMSTVTRWLAEGSPYEGPVPLSATQQRQVELWEAFLNGASIKERLMSRYLYEHLFLGHLYFDVDPSHRSFRIVRSSTPPGEAVKSIATRRPYDDPGVEHFYYRIEPERETLLAKTHMPYALSASRMDKYRRWFLTPVYPVSELPSYAVPVSSNPFVAFRDIPSDSRYRFMLDESAFFIMNFIKGPVCRGQVAVDVIQDRFWVYFVDPQASAEELKIDILLRQSDKLRLPAEEGSDSGVIVPWLEYAGLEQEYLKAKSEFLQQKLGSGKNWIDLSLIWDGDGSNRNAALTVFRHFDSASVVQGMVGDAPKTAWVIGYPLFERIYYLLVAGYDVYGNVGHQLNSRLYMDFMRMEGEFNFLSLLPLGLRQPTAEYWYKGAPDEARKYVYGHYANLNAPSIIDYRTDNPQRELYGLLRERLAPVLDARFDLSSVDDARLRTDLQSLATARGANLAWLPEMVIVRIEGGTGVARYFTLLRNTAHANVTHLFREKDALLPAEYSLTVVPGFIGAYPNALYSVPEREVPAFEAAIRSLASESDYRKLADRFALRRTAAAFWAASDELHDAYRTAAPLEAGLFDYNRLENR